MLVVGVVGDFWAFFGLVKRSCAGFLSKSKSYKSLGGGLPKDHLTLEVNQASRFRWRFMKEISLESRKSLKGGGLASCLVSSRRSFVKATENQASTNNTLK